MQGISFYEQMSIERKYLQEKDQVPKLWSTASYQMFSEKYKWDAATPRDQYERIANTLALFSPDYDKYSEKFFEAMWHGWLSPSTPVLANVGTDRGLPVSCQGSYIPDSIEGIYDAKKRTAQLTKWGFGTSAYLGDIRARGSVISRGGVASGVLPVIRGFQSDMEYVAQGTARRGSWAGYLPIDHGDFDEVANYLVAEPDGLNIGWNVSTEFINKLEDRDPEALRRYQKALRVKMITGKGYFFFPDKANNKRPDTYVERGLDIKASNLCSEIMLHSGDDYDYTCVLSSLNLSLYEEWKDTDLVEVAIVFLDCVASLFIEKAEGISGLEKAVSFTEKSRALGLGVLGWHNLLQKKGIPYEGFEAHLLNLEIWKSLNEQAWAASRMLAKELGEPEWCEGKGIRNTHLFAIAPTKSTALLMGGASEGINPDPAMVFQQKTTAGEVFRVNPVLLDLMKSRGVYNEDTLKRINANFGSVQGEDWLTKEEKEVFKTAFEINQLASLRLAAARGKYLCQWQSLNFYFSANDPEEYINEVHKEAFLNPDILATYYVYGSRGERKVEIEECEACQ